MLPAVSALDCLVADLGIDPAATGLQSYEATDFIVHRRRPDTAATLVLWQIGVVGELGYARAPRRENLALLVDRLARAYPREHEVIVYEASPYPSSPTRSSCGSRSRSSRTPACRCSRRSSSRRRGSRGAIAR